MQLDHQYASAVQKSWAAVAPSEPTLTITDGDMLKAFHLDTAGNQSLTLTQPIGFPGRAWLARLQLRDQAEQLRAARDAAAAQLDANVKSAYFNLQLAEGNLQLNAETARAFERVLEISRRRFEAGGTAQIDVINAQVALLQNENDLADLRSAAASTRAQLATWLKVEAPEALSAEPLKVERHPKVDLNLASRLMIERRPEIRAASFAESAASKGYRLAWASLLPDFQFTLGTTFYREPYGSPYSGDPAYPQNGNVTWPQRTYTVGLQFTIPIWFLFNERAAILGASEDRAAAARAVDIQLNQSRIQLSTVVHALEAAEEKIARFEERILPLTEQSFRLALTHYSSGRIDFKPLARPRTINDRRERRTTPRSLAI